MTWFRGGGGSNSGDQTGINMVVYSWEHIVVGNNISATQKNEKKKRKKKQNKLISFSKILIKWNRCMNIQISGEDEPCLYYVKCQCVGE